METEAASRALESKRLRRQVSYLSARLYHGLLSPSTHPIGLQQQQQATREDAPQADREAVRHSELLREQAATIEVLREEVACLTTLRSHSSPVNTSRALPAIALAPTPGHNDPQRCIELLNRRHEQILTKAKTEHQLKEKASTRQIIRLSIKLALATGKTRALQHVPTPPAAVPYDVFNRAIELLKSRYEQVAEEQHSLYALEMKRQRSSLIFEKRALQRQYFKVELENATATPPQSVRRADVQQALDLLSQRHEQTHAKLIDVTTLQERTQSKYDALTLKFSASRRTERGKKQQMHTRLR